MACRNFITACREFGTRGIFFRRINTRHKWQAEGNRDGFWFTEHGKVTLLERFNEKLSILGVLFAKQCNAVAIQRLRRTVQIANFYSELYGTGRFQQLLRRLRSQFMPKRTRSGQRRLAVFAVALFSWDQNAISDDEINRLSDEIHASSSGDSNKAAFTDPPPNDGREWEKVVDREQIVVWQRPVPDSYVYEYKVYGTFYDIPARAFFDIQVDLDYRKEWDHLLIEVEVVDKDEESDCEVVKWIQHFPYPMYSREYVFIRRVFVDHENQRLVLISRGVEHHKCPENRKFVRVKNYKSNLVLKPHTTVDENGFDYVLSYSDDHQAPIPSVAYSWMASAGVPDYCEKMHKVAKQFHDNLKGSRVEQGQGTTYDKLSVALGNKKTIAA